MRSFFQVAAQTGRSLVISLKQAYLLTLFEDSKLDAPRIDDEHIVSASPERRGE
jgi:mRNA degradation ribonuclease J1/J2